MIELDLRLDPEAVLIGPQFAIGAVLGHGYRLDHLDVAARQCARRKPGLIDRIDEGRGAAVHDRDFRTVDLDDHVVDVQATERRQKVLGCGAKRTLGVTKDCGKFGSGDRPHIGADFALDGAVRRNALEDNAAVIVSRMERKRNRKAGMNADAGNGNLMAERCLLSALHR